MYLNPVHSFHIPVMGIAFTIDSPVKVACYGITSALSIIEDNLIEVMRKHYYQKNKQLYTPITQKEEDYRARRITDYLDLVNRNVQARMEELKRSAFETGSEIGKYFEMLPDEHLLKKKYKQLFSIDNSEERKVLEEELRGQVLPGAIEVNIMTKVDKNNPGRDGVLKENASDALEALKGYAKSSLDNSAVIFSAGMNPRLYNYLESFREFDATAYGEFKKRVIIKVSDYRSALIQGKYLAKKGIWVSEFRIESGLNCGGHAFATQGYLLGPILEEFKTKREELSESLFSLYNPAVKAKGQEGFDRPHPVRITVQGGIGTHQEDVFLRKYYEVDSTGWGTPFLLCPEATTVDEQTLKILSAAGDNDVVLSKASPLGVPFNYLKGTSAETERLERIRKGVPGSPCTEKHLIANTEFTKEPICTASRKYQKRKLAQLETADLPEAERQQKIKDLLSKECLCAGLSNAAAAEYDIRFLKNQQAVTICPGPNISNFSGIASLREMTDHIYGRSNLMRKEGRPHMFLKELQLYIDYIREEIHENPGAEKRLLKGWNNFLQNLQEGVEYYRSLLETESFTDAPGFDAGLRNAQTEIGILAALVSGKENI